MINEFNGVAEYNYVNEFEKTNEFQMSENEYFDEPVEYEEVKEEWEKNKSSSEKVEKEKKWKIRKMLYLVASAVATVTIGNAAIPDMESKMILANDYMHIEYSDGGVIPTVGVNNRWYLLDLNGECRYQLKGGQLLSLPNENGVTAFRGNEGLYTVNRYGKKLWRYEDSDIYIDEAYKMNGLYVSDDNNMVFKGVNNRTIYLNEDGDILWDEIERLRFSYCFPFSDDVAVILEKGKKNNGNDSIVLLHTDGSTEYALKGKHIEYIIDGYSEGYLVYKSRGGYIFYNPTTKDERRVPIFDIKAIYDYNGLVCSNATRNYECNWTNLFDNLELNSRLKRYYKNGNLIGHVGTYACYTYILKEKRQEIDVLLDAKQITEENPHGIVAIYDEIFFDNSKYLLVKDDDKYFYIDFAGNVVSDVYDKATSFSEQGYAISINDNDKAMVMDEEFKCVKVLEDITDVEPQALGDIFVVYQNKDKYIYFYGKKDS